ncbi:guanine deaminase [Deinococcus altitudinis]|uniref:guanine deaminase n=1 Tax=Deinococcus altitudinis TaxID=468914 RepID=UPI0038927634
MSDRILYRAPYLHTPTSPFLHPEALKTEHDGGILVGPGVAGKGTILATGAFTAVQASAPDATVHDLRGPDTRVGVLLPGFVDTHVHYPQVRVLGGLGMGLLEWLDRNTLPEEAKFSSAPHARAVAKEFLSGLAGHGTTTALVFGSHFAVAMDEFFGEARASGLRIVAGQVVSDRMLRPELHTTPERAYQEGKALIGRWHGQPTETGAAEDRLLYAVTPRFSLSASEGILDACAALLQETPGARFTSHLNENLQEIETVRALFPQARDYLDTYERAGLLGRRSVLAHNVHATDRELDSMAAHHCSAAHCPCSNSALGSGFFPLRRHLAAGVHVSLGTDVGGGTGFGMLKEGLQAYFMQQLMPAGSPFSPYPVSPAHLLYLSTLAGAEALDLHDRCGDFSVGKAFDATYLNPPVGTPLETVIRHAEGPERVLAALFTLGGAADVRQVWVGGDSVYTRPRPES